MRHAWRIGRIAGIDTYVHFSFALLVAWVAIEAFQSGASGFGALASLGFLVAVFASVVAHELGHALTGRYFGIATRRIVLSPLGGVAQMEGMPRDPRQEMAVAAAGPAVSLLLAAGLGVLATLLGAGALGTLAAGLAVANLLLGLFNLVPIFPSDGGRILRAWLAWRTNDLEATSVAAKIGQVTAIALGIIGLLTGKLMLAAVAAFLYLMAAAEKRSVGAPNLSWPQVWSLLKSAAFGGRHRRSGPSYGSPSSSRSTSTAWADDTVGVRTRGWVVRRERPQAAESLEPGRVSRSRLNRLWVESYTTSSWPAHRSMSRVADELDREEQRPMHAQAVRLQRARLWLWRLDPRN